MVRQDKYDVTKVRHKQLFDVIIKKMNRPTCVRVSKDVDGADEFPGDSVVESIEN